MKYSCKICSARYLQDIRIDKDQRLSNVRLLYFFDDKAVLRISDTVMHVRPRQVYLIPCRIPVEIEGENSRCYEAIVCIGKEKKAANVVMLDEEQLRAIDLIDSKMKPWLAISDSEHLYLVLINLLYELCTESVYRAENIRNLVGLAISKIAENIERHNSYNSTSPIARITRYMERNPGKDLDLNQIAKETGYSVRYLQQLFLKYKRRRIRVYVNHLRIDNASLYLVCMNDPIAKIAEICGFHNRQSFTRCFKKQIGLTPLEYRRYMANDRTFDYRTYSGERHRNAGERKHE